MTQIASDESILAPFEGMTPALEGLAWQLERRANDGAEPVFLATPIDPSGQRVGPTQEVVLTTGSHHYQIYWFADADGAGMGQMPLVWHIGEKRWAPRKSMFLTPHQELTGSELGRWKKTCIKCHSTNGTHGGAENDTRVAEFGISCEACHGPGAEHVARHEAETSASEVVDDTDDPIVLPDRLSHERSAEVCGQCHAVQPNATPEARLEWEREGFAFRPGNELARTRMLLRGRHADNDETLKAFLQRNPHVLGELFWTDGEVRVSGREYSGLIDSPCFQRGELTCLSCHQMHAPRDVPVEDWVDDQLRPGMRGPGACTSCHDQFTDDAALRAHTRHSPDSAGSNCLNCHMPYTTYGLTKAIRSHKITSPSVVATLRTGRPNACNQCHLDRSLGWAADHLNEWYEHERPQLDGDQEQVAASVLWALQGDAGQRALAAWSLGWTPARAVSGTGWMPYVLSTLLLDSYDAVRWIAVQTVRLHPGYESFELEFTAPLEVQRNHVRDTVLTDWLRDGLSASAEQRESVLVQPDGKLNEALYRALFSRRNDRPVRLAE